MKKYLIIIILAIISGGVLAFFFIKNGKAIENGSDKEVLKSVFAVQTGVYKNESNALKTGGVIISNNDLYHVYTHIFSIEEIIDKVKNYNETNNINYIIKTFTVSDKAFEEISKYNPLLKESSDIAVIDKIGKDNLEIYKNYLTDLRK